MHKKKLKRINLKARVANLVRNPTLIETIRIQNKKPTHIPYHNNRLNTTRRELFGIAEEINLENEISIPGNLSDAIYKCRITYAKEIQKIEFEKHTQKKLTSLKLIENSEIDYHYKYADRSKIDALLALKDGCDDILIVKNGFLTDASYANIALWNGRNWITPATPLLCGTTRSRLIRENSIVEDNIRMEDICNFEKIRIFNAMMDVELPVGNLVI